MAEVELKAGAKLDMLNRKELKEALDTATRAWFNEVSRGDRYRRFSATGLIDGSGGVVIGGPEQTDAVLGPKDGFVWAVKRVGVWGLSTPDPPTLFTEPLRMYLNDEGPSAIVHPAIQGYLGFNGDELVMYPGDTMLFIGAALVATGQVTVTGQAREVPLPLAWRLGG